MTDPASAANSNSSAHEPDALKRELDAIGGVAGHVAHDFNNILAAISGSATLLEIGAPADTPRHIRNIQLASQRGARILRQLLALSPRTDGEMTPTVVGPVIEEACAKVRETLPPACSLSLAVAEHLPSLQADASQIKLLVTILCDNARDAMPTGGQIVVTVAARQIATPATDTHGAAAKPGNHLVIRVEDTGRGVPDDVRPRIFEPFFSTKPKSKDSGTGLGLTIAYRIMLRHGGYIRVESEPASGAAFECYFPVGN